MIGKSSRFSGEWKEVYKKETDETKLTDFGEFLKSSLITFLEHDHLNVLCGLGSSLELNSRGKDVAPTMAKLWSDIKDKVGSELERVAEDVRYSTSEENIENLLSACKLALSFYKEGEEIYERVKKFVETAEEVILKAVNFTDDPESCFVAHAEFLRRLSRRSNSGTRVNLFTTNYDLVFEKVASEGNVILNDGFSFSFPRLFSSTYFKMDFVHRDDENGKPVFLDNVINYFKLHGSIDWEENRAGVVKNNDVSQKPLIIYPRSSKYELSYQTPYLEMITAFQQALSKRNSCLIVAGFGFNDSHISNHILSALKTNISLKVIVVDPGLKDGEESAGPIQFFNSLISKGDNRIVLLKMTFGEFVEVFPDLVAESDWSKHLDRIKSEKVPS